MKEINLYHLIIRYPAIRLFIKECYIRNEINKLFDFLMNIETEEPGQETAQ